MSTELPHLDLKSQNPAEQRLEALKQLFPEAFAEGELDPAVLQRAVGKWVEPGKEKFGLQWPGKAECMKLIQQTSRATLKAMPEDSVNFDTSENLIIEGDNLEVLKLLQKSYFGKVKMIYIDPPYNTGNDFIYPDDYADNLRNYLELTGQTDDKGRRLSTNTESSGRYHTNWLNMMYPRLYLARNLLREDGVIFISLDDKEIHNLRSCINEVFGEENFIAQICHKARASVSNDKIISSNHNHILLFAKNYSIIDSKRKEFGLEPDLDGFDLKDEIGFYKHTPVDGPGGASKGNPYYEFQGVTGYWRYSKETMQERYDAGKIIKIGNGLQQKYYLNDAKNTRKTDTTWWDEKLYTSTATSQLKKIMGDDIFDNPKPVGLIQRMLELWVRNENDLVLDFFGGSGTTAHAVMAQNAKDGGNRKFILVQIPEPTEREDYPTIAHITRERVRRAGAAIAKEKEGQLDLDGSGNLDLGFKAFRLDQSNFLDRNLDPNGNLADQLDALRDNIATGAKPLDLAYEVLIKAGFPLESKLDEVQIEGIPCYAVEDGAMYLCLHDQVTLQAIEAMIAKSPAQIVVRDSAFTSDADKANVLQAVKVYNERHEGELRFQVV